MAEARECRPVANTGILDQDGSRPSGDGTHHLRANHQLLLGTECECP